MRAGSGALRRRVLLESAVRTVGEGGEEAVSWERVADVWAEIRGLAGKEVFVADGLAARATHEVRIRYREGVTPDMRFRVADRLLDIRAARDSDGHRRWLTCLCEESLP